jgi:cytochrome c oxidase cbb3-type subunit 4
MHGLSALAHHYWGLWLLVFFLAIVVWAYMPRRRRKLEEHGHIPLRDDD